MPPPPNVICTHTPDPRTRGYWDSTLLPSSPTRTIYDVWPRPASDGGGHPGTAQGEQAKGTPMFEKHLPVLPPPPPTHTSCSRRRQTERTDSSHNPLPHTRYRAECAQGVQAGPSQNRAAHTWREPRPALRMRSVTASGAEFVWWVAHVCLPCAPAVRRSPRRHAGPLRRATNGKRICFYLILGWWGGWAMECRKEPAWAG